MIDLIGSVAITLLLLIVVVVLLAGARMSERMRAISGSAVAIWIGGTAALAFSGHLAPDGKLPRVAALIGAAVAAGFGAWILSPPFRRAIMGVPLPVLIGLQSGRVLGVFFLLLTDLNRVSEPFGSTAGWGDITVGILAPFIAVLALRTRGRAHPFIALWNGLGILDLAIVVPLGIMSAPGPLHVFGGPAVQATATLPWILIPTLLVPLYLLVHFAIAAKLISDRGHASHSGQHDRLIAGT
jgi:hypothetical protein